MSLRPADLTAVQLGRTALPGAPCAVVRVQIPQEGVTFEGNLIGEPVFNGSEWQVSLTEGTKQLKINVPGSIPMMVTFSDFGIAPLQGKATYLLEMSGIIARYHGTINVYPQNATVVVDSEPIPTVNGTAKVTLPEGSYAYAVTAPGYQIKTGTLAITSTGRNEEDVVLKPDEVPVATAAPAQQIPQPSVATTDDPYNGHEYVDLGLPSGLKWATCNIGADSPTDYGQYFAWGETKPKDDYDYSWENSVTYKQEIEAFSGNPQYDAATANWRGKWRMPTKGEFEELRANCTYRWTGDGAEFTSNKNQAKIFFPAAGHRCWTDYYNQGVYGRYWSASPSSNTKDAWHLNFTIFGLFVNDFRRYFGYPIRPVAK